ncbi:MAG: bifunctional hydroxymethylpyrimidine kinase/phosphomethylpyrimidine kinase, partial [Thermoleophilia bacterium]|nr:bifunctional hydroxymethylpyrimidine kinase/phosphomethylpyrimidine kinase [Thermoleophilia bacterium]
ALAGRAARRAELAEAIHALGAPAVVVTGGHGAEAVDHLFDGREHVEIPVERHETGATHGAGCTHSATHPPHQARAHDLAHPAPGAARVAGEAVRNGLADLGGGEGPVDVFALRSAVR